MSEIKILKNKAYTQVLATGTERELDFGFPLFSSTHIKVEEIDLQGTSKELILETDYTVQGVGQQTGGTITLTTASYPNGALQGYTYNLIQNVPEERTSDFQQSGDFLADTLNTELDLMTQQIQQLRRDVDQAVDVPLGQDRDEFLDDFFSKVDATSQNAQSAANSAATALEQANRAQSISDAFDTNAASKTTDFNNNALAKTTAFNENAANKTSDFNDNYTSKKALIDAEVDSAELAAQTATTQAGIATAKAGEAASSASSATASAATATAKAEAAADSESNAADSASTATTQAGIATQAAGEATTSASTASSKAGEAATSASSAAGSMAAASTKAQAAADSALAAANSATLAEYAATGTLEQYPTGSAQYWAGQAAAGQVQPDWNQTDSTQKDFIKNKPDNLVQNIATAQYALTLMGTASTLAVMAGSINIGYGSEASRNTVALGYNAKASNSYCTSIGYDSQATGYDATALGEGTRATGSAAIAVGRDAIASAADAIQIGKGTNSTAHTLSVGFKGSGVNYTLLTGDGTIPAARFASYDASSKTLILGGNS